MIYYSIPYDTNKNIGKYYNDFMKIIPNDDDYVCFVDGDTIFTTSDYGHLIQSAIEQNPDVGCFTAYTNRIGCDWQIAPHVDTDSNDINYHRKFGSQMSDVFGSTCLDVTNYSDKKLMSGFLFIIKKSTWAKIGCFVENGMLGVDNDLHRKLKKCGEKLYLIQGLYLYHWYRWPDPKNKNHLI